MQLAIDFNSLAAASRSRNTDPATSKQAGKNAARFADSHAGRILAALKLHGPMSPKQMFDFTGLSVVQCDRRRKEMIELGLVRIKTMDDGAPFTHEGCEVWESV